VKKLQFEAAIGIEEVEVSSTINLDDFGKFKNFVYFVIRVNQHNIKVLLDFNVVSHSKLHLFI
jgi:hypothetical protein